MLKSYGCVGGGLEQFSVSPRPLGFGFGTKGFEAKGLGLRVWGQGLRISMGYGFSQSYSNVLKSFRAK